MIAPRSTNSYQGSERCHIEFSIEPPLPAASVPRTGGRALGYALMMPNRAKRLWRELPRLALCGALGLVTTGAVVAALAVYVPIEKAPARVALDGDHLQPWLIELERVGAHRTIWFEKGRIYTHREFGPRDGSGSSAAVSCWSFAISTRNDARTTK